MNRPALCWASLFRDVITFKDLKKSLAFIIEALNPLSFYLDITNITSSSRITNSWWGWMIYRLRYNLFTLVKKSKNEFFFRINPSFELSMWWNVMIFDVIMKCDKANVMSKLLGNRSAWSGQVSLIGLYMTWSFCKRLKQLEKVQYSTLIQLLYCRVDNLCHHLSGLLKYSKYGVRGIW